MTSRRADGVSFACVIRHLWLDQKKTEQQRKFRMHRMITRFHLPGAHTRETFRTRPHTRQVGTEANITQRQPPKRKMTRQEKKDSDKGSRLFRGKIPYYNRHEQIKTAITDINSTNCHSYRHLHRHVFLIVMSFAIMNNIVQGTCQYGYICN